MESAKFDFDLRLAQNHLHPKRPPPEKIGIHHFIILRLRWGLGKNNTGMCMRNDNPQWKAESENPKSSGWKWNYCDIKTTAGRRVGKVFPFPAGRLLNISLGR